MKFIFYFLLIIGIFSCVKNETDYVNLTEDQKYFPLQIGKFWEFEVDSIRYRQGKFLDSTKAYVREEITRAVKDSLGEYYIILVSYKKSLKSTWSPMASYTSRVINHTAIKNTGNVHTIPLTFPLQLNQPWNGLAKVYEEQLFDVVGESVQIYRGWEPFVIKEKIKDERIGHYDLKNVVTIVQTDEEDILNKRYSVEKYAPGIGLVYKSMQILDCNSLINECSNSVPWSKRSTKGFSMAAVLINHN